VNALFASFCRQHQRTRTLVSRRFVSKQRRRRPPSPTHDGTFGMKPVNYSQTPPIMPSPLAPPPRPGAKAAVVRSLWPITLLMTASLGLFIYLNEEEDNTDFWKTIETGGAIVPDEEDDDDYLDEEEEEL